MSRGRHLAVLPRFFCVERKRRLAAHPLSGVRRFKFSQAHFEVEHHLDRLIIRMGIVVAIHVHFKLSAIGYDALPTRLE